MESTTSYDDVSTTNVSSCCEETSEGYLPKALQLPNNIQLVLMVNYLKPYLFMAYSAFGLFGNLITILVILGLKSKRSSTDIFILALAVADLVNSIPMALNYPFQITKNDISAKALAVSFVFFNVLSVNASIIFILLIAMDR